MFLVHNLVDFSLFEPGPMMLMALLVGAALGVRQPSVAGRKKRTAVAAMALGVCVVLWLVAAGFVWASTAVAEDAADDAALALRTNRPGEARRLFEVARGHQRLNADYAFRAAQCLITSSPVYTSAATDLLGVAIATNPLDPEYYRERARYLLRAPEPTPDTVERAKRDYARALELNPNGVSGRLEYADVLALLGKTAAERAEAVRQYEEALRYNDRLKADEPKRLREARVAEIRKKIEELRK
jgi:tetratricopeptide (TPR) repeat protein